MWKENVVQGNKQEVNEDVSRVCRTDARIIKFVFFIVAVICHVCKYYFIFCLLSVPGGGGWGRLRKLKTKKSVSQVATQQLNEKKCCIIVFVTRMMFQCQDIKRYNIAKMMKLQCDSIKLKKINYQMFIFYLVFFYIFFSLNAKFRRRLGCE